MCGEVAPLRYLRPPRPVRKYFANFSEFPWVTSPCEMHTSPSACHLDIIGQRHRKALSGERIKGEVCSQPRARIVLSDAVVLGVGVFHSCWHRIDSMAFCSQFVDRMFSGLGSAAKQGAFVTFTSLSLRRQWKYEVDSNKPNMLRIAALSECDKFIFTHCTVSLTLQTSRSMSGQTCLKQPRMMLGGVFCVDSSRPLLTRPHVNGLSPVFGLDSALCLRSNA